MMTNPVESEAGRRLVPSWTKDDWRPILLAIKSKKCTPFLGAGACAGVLPLGGDVARRWALERNYPFADKSTLPKVAQYMAVHDGSNAPKQQLAIELAKYNPPNFANPNEPHRVITDLRLPLYITTNYDQFLLQAIQAANARDPGNPREPKSVICPWYLHANGQRSRAEPRLEVDPTAEKPLIFHMHGRIDKTESMVLTEDDYLDFLMYSAAPTGEANDESLFPARIQEAFAFSSLLFLGYSLDDMNFKVIFRRLADYMRRAEGARHVSVQLAPTADPNRQITCEDAEQQRKYLEEHFKLQRVKIYWGTCEQFGIELRQQWAAFT